MPRLLTGRTTELTPAWLVPKLNDGSRRPSASLNSARPVCSNCSPLITSIGAGLSATVRCSPRTPVVTTTSWTWPMLFWACAMEVTTPQANSARCRGLKRSGW